MTSSAEPASTKPRTDDMPPALSSMWRALSRGYEAEPRLLLVAFALSMLATSLPISAFFIVRSVAADGNRVCGSPTKNCGTKDC